MGLPPFPCMIFLTVASSLHMASPFPYVDLRRSSSLMINIRLPQGSDFSTIYVRPTTSPLAPGNGSHGNDDGRFPDEVKYVKFSSISWTRDSKGFFYQVGPQGSILLRIYLNRVQRYPGDGHPNAQNGIQTHGDRNAMIYYHRIGTPQCTTFPILLV